MPQKSKRSVKKFASSALVVVIGLIVLWFLREGTSSTAAKSQSRAANEAGQSSRRTTTPPATKETGTQERTGAGELEKLFASGVSGRFVTVTAHVEKILPDDVDGSRHQRFILRVSKRRTVLVAHNIDLAPRVPISVGDEVRVNGKYEWNERGGVLHFTHVASRRGSQGGSIVLQGRTYE